MVMLEVGLYQIVLDGVEPFEDADYEAVKKAEFRLKGKLEVTVRHLTDDKILHAEYWPGEGLWQIDMAKGKHYVSSKALSISLTDYHWLTFNIKKIDGDYILEVKLESILSMTLKH